MTRQVRQVLVEGRLEVPAVRKILSGYGVGIKPENITVAAARSVFWRKAVKFNNAAKNIGNQAAIFIGLADQENPANCSPGLIKLHIGRISPNFLLRISEKMLENWLLGDADSFSDFFKVPLDVVRRESPCAMEAATHPKTVIVNLVRRSTDRKIREGMTPEPGGKGLVGKEYTHWMTEYIERSWNPQAAAGNNESLRRALATFQKSLV